MGPKCCRWLVVLEVVLLWPVTGNSMNMDLGDRQQVRSISVNTWTYMCVCVSPWARSFYFSLVLLQ